MKKVKILLLITVGLIIILEVLFRSVFNQKLIIRHYPDIYQNIEGLGYIYKPNASGTFKTPLRSFHFKTNKQGWQDEDFLMKRENKYRIILVGTSEELGYASFLKQRIENYSKSIEVLNCSIDGGRRDIERIKMIDKILEYEPDVIFFSGRYPLSSNVIYRSYYSGYLICHSKLEDLDQIKDYIDKEHLSLSIRKFLFENSYIFRYTCKYYSENDNIITSLISFVPLLKNKKIIREQVQRILRIGEFDNYHFLNEDESLSSLKSINNYLESKGVKFICSNLLLNEKMKEACESNDIKYISSGIKFDKKYTYGDVDEHLTEKYNLKFVKIYIDNLIKSAIIPETYRTIIKQRKKIKRSN